jgi:splicing factor 3A subunit 1
LQVSIQCPEADDNPQLHGQLLQVELASLTDTVGELKARIQDTIKLAPNKQRLAREGVGFMRDELSLAHYNVDADTTLTLSLRTRGR